MNKKILKILYYLIIIILFLTVDKVIYYFNLEGYCLNDVLIKENNNLKEELKYITKLNYEDYEYEIGKITYNSLYNSNSYFIKSNNNYDNNLVLNDLGLIGILKNNNLTLVKDLTMSVVINDNIGTLKNNIIEIENNEFNINDEIYSYNLSNINQRFLIGYIKDIRKYNLKTIITINYIPINSKYVVILK